METDKVTIEIPAPAAGVLREILKHEQDEIEPGELLGRIQAGAASQACCACRPRARRQAAHAPAIDDATNAAAFARMPLHCRQVAAARRCDGCCSEHGLRCGRDSWHRRGGRITVDDVLEHVANDASNRASPTIARATGGVAVRRTAGRRVPHSTMRKRIAERMVESLLHTAPHVTTSSRPTWALCSRTASATRGLRAARRVADADGVFPRGLRRCDPRGAGGEQSLDRRRAEIPDTINIGVGTAVEGKGLVVPVVRNVQCAGPVRDRAELGELVARAREDKLTPADVRGGTFTISNHGVSGSLVATPIIINQPQSAILGVGKLEKRAVVVSENGEDRIVIRPRCYVTLTLDHRVMDGHRANRFLQVLVERLENLDG